MSDSSNSETTVSLYTNIVVPRTPENADLIWLHYTSSACQHGLCDTLREDGSPACRLICKWNGEHCRHKCHGYICTPCLTGEHADCAWDEEHPPNRRNCKCPVFHQQFTLSSSS